MDASIRLALKRSQGKPIVDPRDEEIDRNYRRAVAKLRTRVEVNGEDWREALDAVRMEVPLGMLQVQQIEDKAMERYGKQEAAE